MASADQAVAVGEADWDTAVLARSRTLPVLVDFWAEWCGPCRALGPVLDALAQENAGRFQLAKVNTDENPELSRRYHIRGIPAVKLFRDGREVAEFVGALPAAQVRAFLDEHIPDASLAAARKAAELIFAGDYAAAEQALAAAPPSSTPAGLAVRARVALLRGRIDEARAAADAIPAVADERELGEAVLAAVALAEEGEAAGEAAAADTAEGRYLRAGQHLAAARLREALAELLEVVRRDRKLRDDGARKLLIALFEVAGARSEISDEHRRQLASLL